jgi:HEPN domain-containing protein
MPPPETDPTRWLAKAADDLRSAEANLQAGFMLPAQSLWASQQSAEKSLKAVLLSLGVRFPFFHDLEALATLVPQEHRPPVSASNLAGMGAFHRVLIQGVRLTP